MGGGGSREDRRPCGVVEVKDVLRLHLLLASL
jgi:hypothetical protein